MSNKNNLKYGLKKVRNPGDEPVEYWYAEKELRDWAFVKEKNRQKNFFIEKVDR